MFFSFFVNSRSIVSTCILCSVSLEAKASRWMNVICRACFSEWIEASPVIFLVDLLRGEVNLRAEFFRYVLV